MMGTLGGFAEDVYREMEISTDFLISLSLAGKRKEIT